jgi:hypothetical protein
MHNIYDLVEGFDYGLVLDRLSDVRIVITCMDTMSSGSMAALPAAVAEGMMTCA